MNWPWHRNKGNWEIRPFDQHLNPAAQEQSFIISDGWEPFGVTAVPNTLDPNQLRIWTRREEMPPEGWVFPNRHRRAYEIKIANAGWGGHEVFLHLTEGWEPFGVSMSFDNPIVWFRRRVT